MLKQRVITALVLLALLLPALWVPTLWPFAALSLLAVTAAGWEWGRLNQAGGIAIVLGGLVAIVCGALWSQGWTVAAPKEVWWVAAAGWLIGGPLALRGGPSAWPTVPRALRWAIGVVALSVAWLALSQAKLHGINFLLSVFCLVWAADIAAYFGGRAFGRRKLAPSISPGKSWEGVWSGLLGVLVLAIVWTTLDRHLAADSLSLFSLLHARWGWIGTVPALAVLAGISVVGDLFESLVKRAAGAKDSSRLLPGHGGVLDRIDALLPVFPIALALTAGA
jgi:phosphatidate cytidylyltransferase